jgi:signal recognition particle receptor subunit beta
MNLAQAAPNFKAQLNRSFGGKQGTIDFVQRLCGSFLLGVPLPKPTIIVFAGPAASGKTTFINTLEDVLGTQPKGYSARVDIDRLARRVKRDEFYDIRNARVVFSNAQHLKGALRSRSIESLLRMASGAKLVVESNEIPVLDDSARIEMIVVPFQHNEPAGI